MPLTPDKKENVNGLVIYDYNLYNHNPNKIAMPAGKRKKTVAITIHNTEWINVASNTTPAEQYVRATQNGAMKSVRVNYYVDNVCAWRCMPDDYVNWSCTDGITNANSGNNTSVAIEVIGDSAEAEANAVKLAAYLLNKYNLTVDVGLRTHTYWLNVKDGVKGTIDYLNTRKNPYKWCPYYILPHWNTFKENVRAEYLKLKNPAEKEIPQEEKKNLFRVRKSWDNVKSQIGAFANIEGAKEACLDGYYVFDWNGNKVWPVEEEVQGIDIFYQVYCGKKWLGKIKNYNNNDDMGYAGIKGKILNGLAVQASRGTVHYRVHIKNGGWLSWIVKCDTNDWINGCAGFKTQIIDGIQMFIEGVDGYEIKYRVSAKNKDYYPWVLGCQDYAGVIGQPIDRIQIQIVKI